MALPDEHAAPRARLSRLAAGVLRARFKPLPKLSVSQWADRYRVLSPEASFRRGPFSTDDAPYQREPMDACGDPHVPKVVLMWGSQLGKTETLNNVVGYFVDQDPSPILVLQPTLAMAEAWSKDRLAPMLRDTPRLRGKVADPRARDSGNTLLHKSYPGGHITIVGANSAAGLASRPIRVLLRDEIDRYPASAGSEGDPSAIAESRTATFPNAKNIAVSSPTVTGSPIDKAWAQSDQRWFLVPCPHCDHEQRLEFGGKDTAHGLRWDADDPTTAHYVCVACGAVIEEADKPLMLRRGRWVAENPTSKVPGFRLSALYSPFFTWARLVERWLRDKGDPLKLRAFVNTMLCEPWEEDGEQVDEHVLELHKRPFPRDADGGPLVPDGVGVLTRSVDVQGDRLETTVWGWGAGEAAWRVHFDLIPGDPGVQATWDALGRRVSGESFRTEAGVELRPRATFVDTGGHHSKQAYDFARAFRRWQVFAIKGSSLQAGVPIISKPTQHKQQRVVTYSVGSFSGKEVLMQRLLKITDDGPGFIALPDDIDLSHLNQFLAEKLVTRFVKGRPVRAWVRTGPNEQIDLYVYALAALHSLGPPVLANLAALAEQVRADGEKLRASAPASDTPVAPSALPRRRGGWLDSWKR